VWVNASASRSAPAGTHGGGRQSSKLRGELASAVRWAPRGAGRNSGLRGTPVADPRTSRSRTAGCGGIACFKGVDILELTILSTERLRTGASRTVTRRWDEPKLEIGDTISMEEGLLGVVLPYTRGPVMRGRTLVILSS